MTGDVSGFGVGGSPLTGPGADELFTALADRTRRLILARLADRPDDPGAVARDLGLSRQAVAKHLRILSDADIVVADRNRSRHVHSVRPERIREVSDLLGVVAEGWDRRLRVVRDRAVEAGGRDEE